MIMLKLNAHKALTIRAVFVTAVFLLGTVTVGRFKIYCTAFFCKAVTGGTPSLACFPDLIIHANHLVTFVKAAAWKLERNDETI